jgi:hypothetical protein
MTLDDAFDHHHTMDIGIWSGVSAPIQGIVFELFASVLVRRRRYGLLYCHGVTRPELEFAVEHGTAALLRRLKACGIYPKTDVRRRTSVC